MLTFSTDVALNSMRKVMRELASANGPIPKMIETEGEFKNVRA
jgi:hypothetical protein